jgi:hypothetical protein
MGLEVDTTAVLFPVAESSGFGARRATQFDFTVGFRGCKTGVHATRLVLGSFDGDDVRHGPEFCQNRVASTT